jgi:hypothetical protein
MRITIRVDDELLKEAKALAARRGRTLASLIEDGLREELLRAEAAPERREVELPTWSGGQLRPGVDSTTTRRRGNCSTREFPSTGCGDPS